MYQFIIFYLILLGCCLNIIVSNNMFHKSSIFSKSFDKPIKDNTKTRNLLDIKKHHYSLYELWSKMDLMFLPSIHPYNNSTKDIYSIFFGGAGLEANNYSDICQSISKSIYILSNFTVRIHFVIFPVHRIDLILLTLIHPECIIRAALHKFNNYQKKIFKDNLNKQSKEKQTKDSNILLTSNDLWCIGHSLGAYLITDLATRFMKGFISIGSVKDTTSIHSSTYSKPLLHIACEQDGLIPYTIFTSMLIASLNHPRGYNHYINQQQQDDRILTDAATAAKPKQLTSMLSNVVLVIKGVNHMQVAQGCNTKAAIATHREDLPPAMNVSLAIAHQRFANPIASFILSNEIKANHHVINNYYCYDPSKASKADKDTSMLPLNYKITLLDDVEGSISLIDDLKYTNQLLQPMIEAINPHIDEQLVNHWQQYLIEKMFTVVSSKITKEQVRKIANIKKLLKLHVVSIEIKIPNDFMYSKPSASIYKQYDRNSLITSLNSNAYYLKSNPIECLSKYRGIPYSTAPTIQSIGTILLIKSKSAAYFAYLLSAITLIPNITDIIYSLVNTEVIAFNEQTMNKALSMVPKHIKERYLATGRKLVFKESITPSTSDGGSTWLTTPPIFQQIIPGGISNSFQNITSYQSISLSVPPPSIEILPYITTEIEKFLGVQYVKIISLSFALEWIYYWSQR